MIPVSIALSISMLDGCCLKNVLKIICKNFKCIKKSYWIFILTQIKDFQMDVPHIGKWIEDI